MNASRKEQQAPSTGLRHRWNVYSRSNESRVLCIVPAATRVGALLEGTSVTNLPVSMLVAYRCEVGE